MPTAALVAGTALSAGGSIMGGIQQQQESRFEAAQLEQQGQVEATRATAEITANDAEARKALGAVNVGAAASGVSPSSGSVRAVRSFDETQAILKDTYARYQGNLAEQNSYYQARAARYQGNQALAGGLLSAGSTVLTGAFNYKALGGNLGLPPAPQP